jgi:hypothetical protein
MLGARFDARGVQSVMIEGRTLFLGLESMIPAGAYLDDLQIDALTIYNATM